LNKHLIFRGVKQSTAFGLSLVPFPAIIEVQAVKRRIATIAAALQTVGGVAISVDYIAFIIASIPTNLR